MLGQKRIRRFDLIDQFGGLKITADTNGLHRGRWWWRWRRLHVFRCLDPQCTAEYSAGNSPEDSTLYSPGDSSRNSLPDLRIVDRLLLGRRRDGLWDLRRSVIVGDVFSEMIGMYGGRRWWWRRRRRRRLRQERKDFRRRKDSVVDERNNDNHEDYQGVEKHGNREHQHPFSGSDLRFYRFEHFPPSERVRDFRGGSAKEFRDSTRGMPAPDPASQARTGLHPNRN